MDRDPFERVSSTLGVIDVFIRTNKSLDYYFQQSALKLVNQLKLDMIEAQNAN